MAMTNSFSLFRFLTVMTACLVLQCAAHSLASQNEASTETSYNKKMRDDFGVKIDQDAENYDREDLLREVRAPKVSKMFYAFFKISFV
jgi:hypothetical protein